TRSIPSSTDLTRLWWRKAWSLMAWKSACELCAGATAAEVASSGRRAGGSTIWRAASRARPPAVDPAISVDRRELLSALDAEQKGSRSVQGGRIRFHLAHHIDRLIDRLGPILGAQRESAGRLVRRDQHAVQSHVDHVGPRGKIFHCARHPACKATLPPDVEGHGYFLSWRDGNPSGLGRHHHVGRRNDGGQLERLARVRRSHQIPAVHTGMTHDPDGRRPSPKAEGRWSPVHQESWPGSRSFPPADLSPSSPSVPFNP